MCIKEILETLSTKSGDGEYENEMVSLAKCRDVLEAVRMFRYTTSKGGQTIRP